MKNISINKAQCILGGKMITTVENGQNTVRFENPTKGDGIVAWKAGGDTNKELQGERAERAQKLHPKIAPKFPQAKPFT